MSWSEYAEYKDSNIQWLGKIPSHWAVDRIKWSVHSSQNGIWGNEADGGPDDIRCVRVADFNRPKFSIHDNDVTFRSVSRAERRGRILRRGDLILEKSGGGEKNPVGFVVHYDREEEAVTSNFVAKVSLARGMEPRFWTYLHHWLYSSRLTQPSIKQTSGIQNLDQQSYFDERVCFPPAQEQVLVADFLDRETAKIDALIVKQQQLVATLREDRTATITHAVSRGLDSDSEPEPAAGVWSDVAPGHWKVAPLKHLVQMQSGVNITAESIEPSGEYAVYGGNGLRGYTSRPTHSGEFILIGRQGALCGNVHRVRGEFWASEHAIVCTPRTELSVGWLSNLMEAMSLGQYSQAAAQPGISADVLGNLRVAVPPVPEQCRMAAMLEASEKRFNALVGKSREIIGTLLEFRSALITDAVTGKIDVRGVA